MKKIITAGILAAALSPLCASADITVKFPASPGIDSVEYSYTAIERIVNAKSRSERGTQWGTASVKDNVAVIPTDSTPGGSQYVVSLGEKNRFIVYAEPGDEILTEIIQTDPVDAVSKGTTLYSGINEVDALLKPIMQKYSELRSIETTTDEQLQSVIDDYNTTVKDFIEENNTKPSAVYALLQLEGEDFINCFAKLSEGAKTSMLFPLAESQKARIEKNLEKERRQKEMQSGDVAAPEFALKDLDGNIVKLSDFKGKWVILDFWGSWCPWCIKGFPELKEAYALYKGELEIVGIDCNEKEDAWRAGVKKYELPWVNVYNPDGSTLLDEYGVQGFPTKAIISPEGKIKNITTGHDPNFFNVLKSLMGK